MWGEPAVLIPQLVYKVTVPTIENTYPHAEAMTHDYEAIMRISAVCEQTASLAYLFCLLSFSEAP